MSLVPSALLIAVTDLGDSAVLGGIVLITTIYLLVSGCRRTALVLLAAFFATAAGIGLLKIIFFSCHNRIALPFDIRSPSGHAALAAVVWGTIGIIIGQQYSGWKKSCPLLIALGLIGFISGTRLALHFHTLDEIIAGLLVGFIGLLLAWILLRRAPSQKFHPLGLVIAALVMATALHGLRLPAEDFMKLMALKLQLYWPFCNQGAAAQ